MPADLMVPTKSVLSSEMQMHAPLSQMILKVSSYLREQQRAAGFWMLRQIVVMLEQQMQSQD
jgi:hypothetical protein